MSLHTIETIVRSVLVLPRDYNQVRPHHLALVYATWNLLSATSVYKRLSQLMLRVAAGLTEKFIPLIQYGVVPDAIIRWGIRLQLRDHLNLLAGRTAEDELQSKMKVVQQLRTMPIAIETVAANEQHYEVPAAFYDLCLGPCKKYSSGLWPTAQTTFEESEKLMLDLYCHRAEVQDGMKIVDLGCGWGSLTLHLAEKYPNCQITGISNSHSQREYILRTAQDRGLRVENINIITCNVADDHGVLDVVKDQDRVMTVEMFEHMKNYDQLLRKVYGFLKPEGKLFVHIFTHKDYCYHFEEGWMSQNFFSGGTMPSDDLLLYFSRQFAVENHWRVSGHHYERTSNGWLQYLDSNWRAGKLQSVLSQAYGPGKEREWYVNWRLFFLACAELWGFDGGNEWIVSHYLFTRR